MWRLRCLVFSIPYVQVHCRLMSWGESDRCLGHIVEMGLELQAMMHEISLKRSGFCES